MIRRALLVFFVALCLYNLHGCASVDMECGMRADYKASPLAPEGEVLIKWAFNSTPKNPAAYGDAECWEAQGQRSCILRLRDSPPTFNEICRLARLGHEVGHAMGGNH